MEEAGKLYDLAIQLGDEEASREAELAKRGLPSRFDAPAARLEKHVATDARFWRGLLRADTEGSQTAMEDLTAAASRDRARFEELIGTSVHALKGRPALVQALREFLRKGRTPPPTTPEFGESVHQKWGFRATEALLAGSGLRPVQHLVVVQIEPREGRTPSVRVGDILLTLDGAPLVDASSYQRLMTEARDRGGARVSLRLVREGKPLEVEFGLDDARVNLQIGVMFEDEPR